MGIRIGIPKSSLYYEEFVLWKMFFDVLNIDLVLSDNTNKDIIANGLRHSVDDMCLPMKVYTGHVLNLLGKGVDYIFIPRIVSVAEGTYSCPKFMGLPDIIGNTLKRKTKINILTITADAHEGKHIIWKNYWKMGLSLGFSNQEVLSALRKMVKVKKKIERERASGIPLYKVFADLGFELKIPTSESPAKLTNPIRIGITGHSYLLYDPAINMDIFKKLNKLGVEIITQEMLPDSAIEKEIEGIIAKATDKLPKIVAWHLGQRTLGATFHFLADNSYDGVIHLCAFACGPGSIVGKLIELKAKRGDMNPLLQLNFDEHTAENAVLTRLEAFVDILRMRNQRKKDK